MIRSWRTHPQNCQNVKGCRRNMTAAGTLIIDATCASVNLSQPYIRPIVREKAKSPVEFGIKFDLAGESQIVIQLRSTLSIIEVSKPLFKRKR